ncbi:hypothetical protein [Vreelandella sp. EE27]
MSEQAKATNTAIITIEPNEQGGFTVKAGYDGQSDGELKTQQAGKLALLGMMAIREALEDTSKTTLH